MDMGQQITYTIMDVDYLKTRGEILCGIIKDWLRDNEVDAIVSDFVYGDMATLVIDYYFDDKNSLDKIKGLSEQILKRFNIEFEYLEI